MDWASQGRPLSVIAFATPVFSSLSRKVIRLRASMISFVRRSAS
jgi:hypothetical protein